MIVMDHLKTKKVFESEIVFLPSRGRQPIFYWRVQCGELTLPLAQAGVRGSADCKKFERVYARRHL